MRKKSERNRKARREAYEQQKKAERIVDAVLRTADLFQETPLSRKDFIEINGKGGIATKAHYWQARLQASLAPEDWDNMRAESELYSDPSASDVETRLFSDGSILEARGLVALKNDAQLHRFLAIVWEACRGEKVPPCTECNKIHGDERSCLSAMTPKEVLDLVDKKQDGLQEALVTAQLDWMDLDISVHEGILSIAIENDTESWSFDQLMLMGCSLVIAKEGCDMDTADPEDLTTDEMWREGLRQALLRRVNNVNLTIHRGSASMRVDGKEIAASYFDGKDIRGGAPPANATAKGSTN